MDSSGPKRGTRFSIEREDNELGPAMALVRRGSATLALLLLFTAGAQADLPFTAPQFLPGDAAIGSPAGMQVEADVVSGGGQYLVVWSAGRTTPDDYDPFATEGSGTDIYAVRLDGAGDPIRTGSQPSPSRGPIPKNSCSAPGGRWVP